MQEGKWSFTGFIAEPVSFACLLTQVPDYSPNRRAFALQMRFITTRNLLRLNLKQKKGAVTTTSGGNNA